MDKTAPANELERRKQIKIRLRPDLSIEPQKYEGRTYYVVKDPVSMRYYRFKEQEHFLIGLMDGSYSLDDAQKAYEKRFRPERLTLEDLESFAQQLLTAGLAHNESPQAGSVSPRRSGAGNGTSARPPPPSAAAAAASSSTWACTSSTRFAG